jgi:tRNA 2-selenouridine synthase
MVWREISASQMNSLKDPLIVDVRSPCEHEAERIISSRNIPLLSNAERVLVGTLYVQQGELVARRQAVKLIAPKIPEILNQICELRKPGQTVVVHCWRGGLRSEAVASMLSIVGLDCFRLTGGYKAWRRQLLSEFAAGAYEFVPVVLHGNTGVGKTELLRELEKAGQAVLDLEALANHRGSVFGGMGLGKQPTQKNFESLLWSRLRSFRDGHVFMEAESRKIGKIALPDCIFERIQHGRMVLVGGSLEQRAGRIIADYAQVLDSAAKQQAFDSLMCLKERLGVKLVQEIQELFLAGRVVEAVKMLLVEYYDPLYSRQIKQAGTFELEVNGDDPVKAARQVLAWLPSNVTISVIPESKVQLDKHVS